MIFGELERMNTKQLRCILYDCRDRKYIPYKCLLPKGIWKMKKFDLIELIMTLEYFIPTCIVVRNKYDKVNKQLLLNYFDRDRGYGEVRWRGKKKYTIGCLKELLKEAGHSHYNVLDYAIGNELRERARGRCILPYVDKIDIVGRLKDHLKVIEEIYFLTYLTY